MAVGRPRPCTTRRTKFRHSRGAQLGRTIKIEPTAAAMRSLSHVPKLMPLEQPSKQPRATRLGEPCRTPTHPAVGAPGPVRTCSVTRGTSV